MKRIFKYKDWLSLIIISFIFLATNTVVGQIQVQGFCTNTDVSSPSDGFNSSIQNLNETGPFYLKLYIHVIRDANGNGGQTDQAVEDAVGILAQDFNPHNVFFVWDCNINYIDSDVWFQGPSQGGNTTGIYSVNNHYDGIDAYLFPDVANSSGGRANGVGGSSEFWVAGTFSGLPVATSHITSHEMGHVINLWHTHHGCESGIWENTNGSNCTTAGDYVCDTPSDPHLGFDVNTTNCEWSGMPACLTPEPIGNYDPDEQIIMAYTQPACMAYFTNGQGQRMRNSIAALPYLQATQTSPATSSCLCLDNQTFVSLIAGTEYHTANDWILGKTNNVIQTTADVTYQAGNIVRLESGFKALEGCDFRAFIAPCSSNKTGSDSNNLNEKETAILINELSLNIFPNPTSGITNIVYNLPKESNVSIAIFDGIGKEIALLQESIVKSKGSHNLQFDVSKLPTGIYHVRIESDDFSSLQKIVIAR